MKYNKSLFESIKESLKKKNNQDNTAFKDILKLEKNKTYIVRLIPNLEDVEKTFFHYYSHTWISKSTGNIIGVFCPNTYGEKCPIDEYRSKIWKKGDKKEQESIKPLSRNEQWLVNVYVIKDPTNPENQGKVKILRYGKQLAKIIDNAISGDESDEFGDKIFDLSENGCNLKIKVEENEGGYATYVASRFQSPSEIDGLENVDDVYSQVKNFEGFFKVLTYDEIKSLLDKHWLCLDDEDSTDKQKDSKGKEESFDDDLDDDLDSDTEENSNTIKKTKDSDQSVTEQALNDKELDDLLKDL